MADELAEVGDYDRTFKLLPNLEAICLKFIGENGKRWSLEDFAGGDNKNYDIFQI